MPRRSSKSPQRAFLWREPFLEQLRRNPKVNLACKAAGISRNTVYTHLRKDARFRRQWEHALDEGFAEVYRAHEKSLRADPQFQRVMQRAKGALQWWHRRQPGITD